MPKCLHCGAELDEDAKFCSQCARPVLQNQSVVLHCRVCGGMIDPVTLRCPRCDPLQGVAPGGVPPFPPQATVQPPVQPPVQARIPIPIPTQGVAPAPQSAAKKKSKGLIVGVSVGAAVLLFVVLAVILLPKLLSPAAPAGTNNGGANGAAADVTPDRPDAAPADVSSDFKIGLICLHDENSVYDNSFIRALRSVQQTLGLPDEGVLLRTNVSESEECHEAAAELAESGCGLVFADSFGHESYLIRAAQEYPDVEFVSFSGTRAHTEGLPNFHNAYAAIFEGRYLTGIAAGMKLNQMIADGEIPASGAVLGFVGAFPFAEVISGMTAFYLGAKSVCPTATMKVRYANSWYDIVTEREAAEQLIMDGCVLISQHSTSSGVPDACKAAGVPNVPFGDAPSAGYDGTFLIASDIDWSPVMLDFARRAAEGSTLPTDYTGNLATGEIVLTDVNPAVAAPGTDEALRDAADRIRAGTLRVFDTATFTVDGQTLTSYLADVDDEGDFAPDTEVVSDGYFHESEYRSAPYFDLIIDGIEVAW